MDNQDKFGAALEGYYRNKRRENNKAKWARFINMCLLALLFIIGGAFFAAGIWINWGRWL